MKKKVYVISYLLWIILIAGAIAGIVFLPSKYNFYKIGFAICLILLALFLSIVFKGASKKRK